MNARAWLRSEHGRDRIAAALADDDNHLALAGLIADQAAVKAILFLLAGLM